MSDVRQSGACWVIFGGVALAIACDVPPETEAWPMAPVCADDAGGSPAVPSVAGEYVRVFVPPGTRYVNDHTIVRGPDGWHLLGITSESVGAPFEERSFLHATAPTLLGPWTPREDALVADAAAGESVLWAPHVIEPEPGRWSMYYWSDAIDGRGIRRADSVDLAAWSRVAVNDPTTWPPGGRDPFVMRWADRWLALSVGVTADSHGLVVVSESPDREAWSELAVALEDPRASYPWGGLESPAVVQRDGYFYLFVLRGLEDDRDYFRTLVFRSCDPRRFGGAPVAELHAHAAEVIADGDDWYITSAGWTSQIGEERRGLSIAPLEWIPAER